MLIIPGGNNTPVEVAGEINLILGIGSQEDIVLTEQDRLVIGALASATPSCKR